jgi:hypothetical protein
MEASSASPKPTEASASARAPATAAVPLPITAPGSARVAYLSDEQKKALNKKYGKIKPPSAADMREVVTSGDNCKMQ